MNTINDPFGQAVLDFYTHKKAAVLNVLCDDFDDDEIPVPYLFRKYTDMPPIEKIALNHCKGSVLDVGAGTGCHSLWLQKKGILVTAMEQSLLCAEVMLKLGVEHVVHHNFYLPYAQKFDTLLLLMNGAGIAGTLDNFPLFLRRLKELLNKNGQVLIDSSDLIFLFEDEEGVANIPLNGNYYGELIYKFQYENTVSEPFPWLFIDEDLFREYASQAGFNFEVLKRGENHDYLARLSFNTI